MGEGQQTAVLHDVSPWTALMVKVENGRATVGIDGLDRTATLPAVPSFSPLLERINVRVIGVVEGRQMVIDNIALGTGEPTFKDGLHKTMVPDGKDFAFTYIIHADRAYPGQLGLMTNISERYGLRGTYDAWTNGTDRYYGMDDPEFLAALHGAPRVRLGHRSARRQQRPDDPGARSLSSIENLTKELGPPRSWSDHAFLPQDLAVQGWNSSSDLLHGRPGIADGVGMGPCLAWDRLPQRPQPHWHGLPGRGVGGAAAVPRQPGHVLGHLRRPCRRPRAWTDGWGPGPMERSLIVVHDYFAYLSYASQRHRPLQRAGGPGGDGPPPWGQLYPKQVLTEAEWRALPQFEDFLNWTAAHDVWFTTLREAYDRSQLVDRVRGAVSTRISWSLTNPGQRTGPGADLVLQVDARLRPEP